MSASAVKFVRTYRCPACAYEMVVKYAHEPEPHGTDPRDLTMQCPTVLRTGCAGVLAHEGTVPA